MTSNVLIQDIRPQHTADLRRLFRRAVAEDFSYFPDVYQKRVLSDNNWPRLLMASLRPQRIMLGSWWNGQLAGYTIAGINGNDSGKLYWLYVAPEGRGQNLGQTLLKRSLQRMHQEGMRRVSLVTHNYRDYYTKFGFQLEKSQQLYGVSMNIMSYQWPKK